MNNEKEISFGAFDSELMRQEIFIPKGFEATIEGDKIILTRKDSEDERIRKFLIKWIQDNYYNGTTEIPTKTLIAWLEKQGKEKPTLPKWKYKKDSTSLLKDSIVLNKYGCVAKLPSGAIVSDVWVLDYSELAKLPKEELEEQSEQKPADNVEPKFKVGDRITKSSKKSCPVHSSIDDTICEVTEVHDTCYILNTKEGRIQEPFEWQDYYEIVEPAWSKEDNWIKTKIIKVLLGCET